MHPDLMTKGPWADARFCAPASPSQHSDEDMADLEEGDGEYTRLKAIIPISGGGSSGSSVVDTKLLNGSAQSNGSNTGNRSSENNNPNYAGRRTTMTTGCIPCLMLGIPCDPTNPACKLAMSSEWSVNGSEINGTEEHRVPHDPSGLAIMRLDTKWQRIWRERHSLNFFVNYSAPQLAGFFENDFWSRCIQHSYHEPVVLHAISAFGSLHEAILQGAFQDEKTKAQAVEFALTQFNRSIAYLTGSKKAVPEKDGSRSPKSLPVSKLALFACVLFTCFESMQGHLDSAIKHALQGKALMMSHHSPDQGVAGAEDDDTRLMRTLVDRLEVQAMAMVGTGDRSTRDETSSVPPLPAINKIFNIDHAHSTLHTAMNSNMQYLQRFHPDAPADHHAIAHAKKALRYGPWYEQWEVAFSAWLAEQGSTLSNYDRKRAMVLKANQLVGTMIAISDHREGSTAYDRFDNEFSAIVDLAREVLADFSCPPLPTLTAGSGGKPYFSCSLWVTDPLWMAISRCKNPHTRQAAFALLSQNPRQEGIWHTGPKALRDPTKKVETGPASPEKCMPSSGAVSKASTPGSGSSEVSLGEVPKAVAQAEHAGNMRARSEWVDSMASSPTQDSGADDVGE